MRRSLYVIVFEHFARFSITKWRTNVGELVAKDDEIPPLFTGYRRLKMFIERPKEEVYDILSTEVIYNFCSTFYQL